MHKVKHLEWNILIPCAPNCHISALTHEAKSSRCTSNQLKWLYIQSVVGRHKAESRTICAYLAVGELWCFWYSVGGVINLLTPSELSQRWFRQWLAVRSMQSHYYNQWWCIINLTLRNKLQWDSIYENKILKKMHLEKYLQNVHH